MKRSEVSIYFPQPTEDQFHKNKSLVSFYMEDLRGVFRTLSENMMVLFSNYS